VGVQPRVDAGNEPLAVPKRRWWTRLSSAHILIFSAGALAFVANLAVLRPSELPPRVAVAAVDLLPGALLDPDRHVEFVPMSTDSTVLASFISEAVIDSVRGRVVSRRIDAGEVVVHHALAASDELDGLRLMSLPIDSARAAGGTIDVGDIVDIIAVERGTARFVLTATEVVALPAERSNSFAAASGYHVVLAVDAGGALALSAAMDAAHLHVVRSTGSPDPDVLLHHWVSDDAG
jgi:Flp pilus assembly protein CpaB